MIPVVVYLAAIVAANLVVTTYGPGVSIVTAFLFEMIDPAERPSAARLALRKDTP